MHNCYLHMGKNSGCRNSGCNIDIGLQVDGATFTFVDLPGIQQWPSADSETSKALVASYLTDAT